MTTIGQNQNFEQNLEAIRQFGGRDSRISTSRGKLITRTGKESILTHLHSHLSTHRSSKDETGEVLFQTCVDLITKLGDTTLRANELLKDAFSSDEKQKEFVAAAGEAQRTYEILMDVQDKASQIFFEYSRRSTTEEQNPLSSFAEATQTILEQALKDFSPQIAPLIEAAQTAPQRKCVRDFQNKIPQFLEELKKDETPQKVAAHIQEEIRAEVSETKGETPKMFENDYRRGGITLAIDDGNNKRFRGRGDYTHAETLSADKKTARLNYHTNAINSLFSPQEKHWKLAMEAAVAQTTTRAISQNLDMCLIRPEYFDQGRLTYGSESLYAQIRNAESQIHVNIVRDSTGAITKAQIQVFVTRPLTVSKEPTFEGGTPIWKVQFDGSV